MPCEVGQRVRLSSLAYGGPYPGTIIEVGDPTNGQPTCTVRLDETNRPVCHAVWLAPGEEVVKSCLWQCCRDDTDAQGAKP